MQGHKETHGHHHNKHHEHQHEQKHHQQEQQESPSFTENFEGLHQEHYGQQQAARALPQGGGFSLLSLFLSKKTIKNRKSEIREPDRR